MSVTIEASIVGNQWPAILAGLQPKAELIVAKAAMDIQAHAQGRAPVDTGTLKNSIQAVRVGAAHWRVVVGADYGVYVEYGTYRMAAQPYLRPAVQTVRPLFLAALKGLT
jgi:HK97 gp10 family phage protein